MKGIIFTEFLELVEEKFGLTMVDQIINQSELESGGAYTSIGTYDFSEMLQLLTNLSQNTSIPADDLLMVFSEHLFAGLTKSHPDLVKHYKDPMDLLASIEGHIHVEVQKIYPDAQLPTFEIVDKSDNRLEMIYKSDKGLYMLGKGLMQQTFKVFGQEAEITCEKLKEDGTEVKFIVIR
ncbi:heme NO-binding domain-containing protein [Ochrovirga pacifica]|uniref:heme NO-binding domain-containing protein n=1 Tax=Ochrovirga pacifica TaxID=1042376 RepID=UPI000255A006|nr:heme NO-binding domain-containing protein [Ochrovirga pacifica]